MDASTSSPGSAEERLGAVTRMIESLIDDLTVAASDPHCDREGLLAQLGAGLGEIEHLLTFGFQSAQDNQAPEVIGTCARCGHQIHRGEPYAPAPPFHLAATDWFRHASPCPTLLAPSHDADQLAGA